MNKNNGVADVSVRFDEIVREKEKKKRKKVEISILNVI